MENLRTVFPGVLVTGATMPTVLAHAEPWAYVKGAQVEPKGEWEVSQWVTGRFGKEDGRYAAYDFRTELEYGVTEKLEVSLNVDSGYHDFDNSTGSSESFGTLNRYGFSGLASEIKYQILSPQSDPVGFALYFEPAWSRIGRVSGEHRDGFEFETIFILQKELCDHRLIAAFNYVIDPEWKKDGHEWETGLEMAWLAGLSWRFGSHWRIGAECRLKTEFEDANLNESEFLALSAGPAIHYVRDRFEVNLTVLPQVAGWPDKRGTGGLHLDEMEKMEARLRVKVEF